MKIHLSVLLFLLLCFCYNGLGQKVHMTELSISKDAILSDMVQYADILSKKHIHPFNVIKKKDFFARMRQITDSADNLNIDQLFVRWQQLNALIRDSHTSFSYTSTVGLCMPIKCYWFDEGIYITCTDDSNTQLLHSRIIAVNGHTTSEVVNQISTVIQDTNQAGLKDYVPFYIVNPIVLHGLGIADSRDHIVYTLINSKQDTIQITPKIVSMRSMIDKRTFSQDSLLSNRVNDAYGYTSIDGRNCIYFKYSQCWEEKKLPLNNVIKKLEQTIEKKRPDKLIIDLRDNRGGYPYLLEPFINYLNVSHLNKKGGIYVLIGRRTCSAAVLNAVYLKNHTYAVLLGEPSSGSVRFYAGVETETLPATKFVMNYSTQFLETNERYSGSLRPDVEIPVIFSDYAQGIDAAVNYALSH